MIETVEASLDIGTNTILLLIGVIETDPNTSARKIKKVLFDDQTIVKLGQGVHKNRSFSQEAMERARNVFQKYSEVCRAHNVSSIYAVATSASRDAANGKEFYEDVYKRYGIRVHIIDGNQEAKWGFVGGLLPSQNAADTMLVDIGGGSTEFVTINKAQSINMGSVRATEMYLSPCADFASNARYTVEKLQNLESGISKALDKIDAGLHEVLHQKKWTGIAGTITTLAALKLKLSYFEVEKIHGSTITLDEVVRIFEMLSKATPHEREAMSVIGTGRADVITAGAAILKMAMQKFNKKEITVSTRGLRYGVLQFPKIPASE